MKTTVADYRYRVLCMRVVPISGSPVYLTDHPRDLIIGGVAYKSTYGHQFSGVSATSGFSPTSIDLEGIASAAGISRAAVSSGVFDGARCYVFATSWLAPVVDQEPIVAGVFGQAVLLDDRYQIGGVSLIDALNQSVGETIGAQCPKTFLSQGFAGCKVPVAANTVTGTLTGVVSQSQFTDSARTEPSDTFGAGTIKFTSGANAGLRSLEVKSFAAGVITTFEPFYYLPQAGDAYTMVRGCRKRMSDCQSRWDGTTTYNNVVNFGGYPWVPTGSTYSQVGQGGA